MTSIERFRAAQRIQARILKPEPFEHNKIQSLGEQCNDSERAVEMLETWANKFGVRATRRHFIDAVKDPDVGYSNVVPDIFSGKFLVVLRACYASYYSF